MQFVRCLSGMLASAAADVDTKFIRERLQPALEGADDAGRDAGRVPIHPHDCTEGLEPERMRQPLKEFVSAVMVDDRLSDDRAERGHARGQPGRYAPAVQRKNCRPGASCHRIARPSSTQLYQARFRRSGETSKRRFNVLQAFALTSGHRSARRSSGRYRRKQIRRTLALSMT